MASLVESGPLFQNPFSEPGVPQLLPPPAAALFDGGPTDEFIGPLYQPVTQSGPTTMIGGGGASPFGGAGPGVIVGIVTP